MPHELSHKVGPAPDADPVAAPAPALKSGPVKSNGSSEAATWAAKQPAQEEESTRVFLGNLSFNGMPTLKSLITRIRASNPNNTNNPSRHANSDNSHHPNHPPESP
jgi:hypothetical protein